MTQLNEKRILTGFLLLVFLTSLSYSFYFRVPPAVDARAYDNIAWNIVQGNGYRESLEGPLAEDNAIMRVGPGYEIFLAIIYFIFGHYYWVIWIVQALLLSLSTFFIFLAAKKIFGNQWGFGLGLAAAALIGFSPDLITMQSMIMSETLGIFLISALIYLVFRYFEQPDKFAALAGGIGLLLGFTAMVRTPALFLIFPIAWLFLARGGKNHFLIFSFAIALIFSPWIIRNWVVYQTFIPTNLAYGVDLASGNHPGATGELEPYGLNDQYLEQYGLVEGSRLLTGEALGFALENPLEFLKITFYRISIYFSFARPTGFWFHLHGLSRAVTLLLSSIYSAILFIFGFWGILSSLMGPVSGGKFKNAAIIKEKFWLLAAMLVATPIAIMFIIVETRYRFVSYPFFAIFAGYSFQKLFKGGAQWKTLLYVIALLFLNTGFDALRNLNRIFDKIQNL